MSGLCYVNGNFLVALDRGDSRALRFLEKYRSRLYTIANIMDEDVSGARSIASAHGISIRYMNAAEIMKQASIATRLLEAVSKKYTLGENDPSDIDHIAAAVATGARYFVTSESKLCKWIREYKHITGEIECIDWRKVSCNDDNKPGRDKAHPPRTPQENRPNSTRQGPHKSSRSRGASKRDSNSTKRVQARQNNQGRGRKKARKARGKKGKRKRKVAGRKQRRRRSRRGRGRMTHGY